MEDYLKEMINKKTEGIDAIVQLVCNTVKAKYLYGKGGWSMVDAELGNAYCNPNFGMSAGVLNDKVKELQLGVGYSTISDNLDLIVNLTNEKLKCNIVSKVVDRLHIFITINA